MIYIAVDGGTTNTRINLVKDGAVADTVKIKMGARACMSELAEFKKELKNGIYSILSRNGLSENDIEKILASGMITCEFGLCPLEHIVAPAGIKEMHEAMHEEKFPDIYESYLLAEEENILECKISGKEKIYFYLFVDKSINILTFVEEIFNSCIYSLSTIMTLKLTLSRFSFLTALFNTFSTVSSSFIFSSTFTNISILLIFPPTLIRL